MHKLMAYHFCQPSNGEVNKVFLFFRVVLKGKLFLVVIHISVVICFIIITAVISWTK